MIRSDSLAASRTLIFLRLGITALGIFLQSLVLGGRACGGMNS